AAGAFAKRRAPRTPPGRQRPAPIESEELHDGARARQALGKSRERLQARGVMRVARHVADQPVAQRGAVPALVVREKLDLHARHVDAGGTFAPASLAGDTELERLAHRGLRGIVRAKLAGEREAQRVGAPARQVALVAGRAEARAHGAGVELAAMAVVVAH